MHCAASLCAPLNAITSSFYTHTQNQQVQDPEAQFNQCVHMYVIEQISRNIWTKFSSWKDIYGFSHTTGDLKYQIDILDFNKHMKYFNI